MQEPGRTAAGRGVARRSVFAVLAGGWAQLCRASAPTEDVTVLHIALHEGFDGQTVDIRVNGRPVYRRSGVTTDLSIARADAVEVEVAEAVARVEVEISPGGIRAETRVHPAESPFLAISLVGGQPVFRPSSEPFRYL